MLDAIKAELVAVNRFIDLLQQEQAALVKADVDTLLPLSDNKSKQADALRKLAQQRIDGLSRAGFTSDRQGMEDWISGQKNKPDAESIWSELLQAGHTAQRLNELNGKLILIHLQHNQQALSALSMAANQASVYGPDGQAHTTIPTSNRIIGKV